MLGIRHIAPLSAEPSCQPFFFFEKGSHVAQAGLELIA
ncbi:Gnl3l [Phodopus roborovskii]|uniref:Gnl3l protein n=1 Tax=Phodopus roborovskii TaxID=109678 RepID=A0AAU9ZTA3_PHORO|nr:Gnl3l [Phodopus roborovskii]